MLANPDCDGQALLGVAVVIVNFRTMELTAEAVRSVADEAQVREIVVVDNNSGDGSIAFLRATLGHLPVRILESPTNVGFGMGINLGAAACEAPLLFVLNSDAVVVPGALRLLSDVLTADETIGIVAPAVYGPDGMTLQEPAYGSLPRPLAMLRASRPLNTKPAPDDSSRFPEWVSGVAMLLQMEDFMELGGFDPDFTMYLEDVDLCRRMAAIGKRVAREPAAGVVHLLGRSDPSRANQMARFQRSKALYLKKVGATSVQICFGRVLGALRVGWERAREWGP